jgi:hypothetical protein
VIFVLLFAGDLLAAPRAELWPRWQAHDQASTMRVDHGAWAEFLKRHRRVDAAGVARIAYARVTPADRAALSAYIQTLEAVPVSRLARAEQFAFWVNLYNAVTVRVVLDHHPVASIRRIGISPGLFAIGPWGAKLTRVEGEPLSLDDIEHRILRPIWRDPRVHYAVNCAAIGCPNLAAEPFTGDDLEAQLDRAARAFVGDRRGVMFDGDRLVVSSIYRWFQDDFGPDDAAVVRHLRRYADPALAARLTERARLDEDRYDWSLADAPE